MESQALEAEKLRAARAAVALVPEKATLAIGSGSTAHHAIKALAARFPGGGGLRCVASSRRSEEIARRLDFQIVPLQEIERFDLMLDGADEVAPNLTLIKGGGGAHFREKLLARLSEKVVIMVDHTKVVRRLGGRSPLPVEVIPFAIPVVARTLTRRGLQPTLRMSLATSVEGEPLPFVTDNGNHILDCRVPTEIPDERLFDQEIRIVPGVVETGLFVGMASLVLVGMPDGRVEELMPRTASRTPASPSFMEEALAAHRERTAAAAAASSAASPSRAPASSPSKRKPASRPARRNAPAVPAE